MTEVNYSNGLDRNAELVVAAVYEREVGASLERVWENVYDWEHLPWLHSEAFDSIEEVDSGEWGWRARIGLPDKSTIGLELITNRAKGEYVSRTVAGAGAPSEIWTSLVPRTSDKTAIRVEFCVKPMPEKGLRNLGKGFVSLYTLLWDQDEEMMQTRERALTERGSSGRATGSASPLSLGSLAEVRARLPFCVDFLGNEWRIVEQGGELFAHSTECPHRLGPLGECPVVDNVVSCPWHGYEFDIRSGESIDGRKLRLRPAPLIRVDASTHLVSVEAPLSTEGPTEGPT